MRDEARNTGRHSWSSPLRTLGPISFIPAGALDPAELLKPLNAEPGEEVHGEAMGEDEPTDGNILSTSAPPEEISTAKKQSDGEDNIAGLDVGKLDLGGNEEPAPVEKESEGNLGFAMDLTGDADLAPKIKAPAVRAPSPTPSVSSNSSEKIVFVPRSRRGAPPPKPQKTTKPATTTVISSEPVAMATTATKAVVSSTSITLPQLTEAKAPQPEEDIIKLEFNGKSNDKRATQGNKRRKPKRDRKVHDEATEDYIENIAAQELASVGNQPTMAGLLRGPGGDDSAWVDDSSTDEDEEAARRYRSCWVEDIDAASTDGEGPKGVISLILRKRSRPSGLQYLIKWDGYETDDATWTLAAILDSSATDHIRAFETLIVEPAQMSESSGSESSDEEDDKDDNNDENDEDLDLKLARMLQRQEELQMMGVVNDSFDEIMDLEDGFFPMGQRRKQNKKRKSRQGLPEIMPAPSSGHYPSASKMAEDYDRFVMDWERPSVARKGKGKGKIMPDLNQTDPDIAAQLKTSWQRDREKKKLRKIHREERRAQGFLNTKACKTGQPLLVDKYKKGMSMSEVCTEIRSFMLRGNERYETQSLPNWPSLTPRSLALPPMSKSDRKLVHNLASKLYLKSKSVGSDTARFTTLIKTSRSGIFECDEESIDWVLRTGKSLKRMDVGSRGARKGPGGGSLREDMKVGAEAPELSVDNRGRLMLEKLGYRSGMTLGAVEGRGISEPVIAIMKMSKAGLG